MQSNAEPGPELFRASKRRKFYRKRTKSEDQEPTLPIASILAPRPLTVDELIAQGAPCQDAETHQDEVTSLSVAGILRQRKLAQRKKGGIEFTNLGTSTAAQPQPSNALVDKEVEAAADIRQVIERFAPQTGQFSDSTDKHMYVTFYACAHDPTDAATNVIRMAYIDSESSNGALLDAGIHRQPAALGKLHEIDLGPDATRRNIARTEAAQRKMDGTEPEIDQATGKIRLRRDGRPWGYRKRRNSEDVKRDKLVEEVMRESRLDIYDEPELEPMNDDQAADDRIAEQFRREFMDAISTRKHKTTQVAKPVKGKAVEEVSKGPKLGGSRSARAAMRERELAAKKK